MKVIDPEKRKQGLLLKRDELRKRLAAIREDHARGLEADLEEQALQLENAEVLEEIAKVTAAELERVECELKELATSAAQRTNKGGTR